MSQQVKHLNCSGLCSLLSDCWLNPSRSLKGKLIWFLSAFQYLKYFSAKLLSTWILLILSTLCNTEIHFLYVMLYIFLLRILQWFLSCLWMTSCTWHAGPSITHLFLQQQLNPALNSLNSMGCPKNNFSWKPA